MEGAGKIMNKVVRGGVNECKRQIMRLILALKLCTRPPNPAEVTLFSGLQGKKWKYSCHIVTGVLVQVNCYSALDHPSFLNN